MANKGKPNRQRLIDADALGKKKRKTRALTRPQPGQAKQQAPLRGTEPSKSNSDAKAKLAVVTVLLLIALGIASPKMQLVTYEQQDVISTSIYVSGWFSLPGGFTDMQAKPFELDKKRGHFYVCRDVGGEEDCQRFNVIEVKGLLSAVQHWFKQP